MKPTRQNLVSSIALFILFATVQFASAFYDPSVGRWLNRDPMGDEFTNTGLGRLGVPMVDIKIELIEHPNLYAFTRNSAVNISDPFGLWCVTLMTCTRTARVPGPPVTCNYTCTEREVASGGKPTCPIGLPFTFAVTAAPSLFGCICSLIRLIPSYY